MRKTLLAALVLLMTAALPAQAQEDAQINVFAGLSAPTGDFADDTGSDAGAASFGIGVMAEYVQSLGSPGLGWASSASLLVNGADDDLLGTDDIGRYFIVPVLTGLRYRTELSPTMDGYGIGQIGLSIARPPSGEEGDIEFSPNVATSLGFGFGGGIILNDRINITARYLVLGEPEFEYDVEGPGIDDEVEGEIKINVFQVMIGIPIGE